MKNKTNTTKVDPRDIIAKADKKNLTMFGEAVINFIIICIEWVLGEIADSHKRLFGLTHDDIKQMAIQYIEESKASKTYKSDWHLLSDYYKSITDYVWAVVNRKEAEFIIENLDKNDVFMRDFFYGTNYAKLGVNMKKVLGRILKEANSTYHLALIYEDIATFVYESFIMGDSYQKLHTFGFRSSIFSWLGVIARRAVISHLEDTGMIKISREMTAANTRLTLMSKCTDYCQYVLDSLVFDESTHTLLSMVYVKRMKPEQIAEELNITIDECNKSIKKADTYLRDCIVRSSYDFEDAISEKESREVMITGDAAMDILQWVADKGGNGVMSDFMGLELDNERSEALALSALAEIEASLKFSEIDRIIWLGKAQNASSSDIAEDINKTAGYVDVKYSRLRKRFGIAARKWAVKKGIITPEECAAIEQRIAEEEKKKRYNGKALVDIKLESITA